MPFTTDLEHLGLQGLTQAVLGPIQDDEALFLFALVRTSHVERILEIGGQTGFSARNFLAALRTKPRGRVFTVDVHPVAPQSPFHTVLQMDAARLTPSALGRRPLDLLLLDCHDFNASVATVTRILDAGLLVPQGFVVLHDTGLHPRRIFRRRRQAQLSNGLFVHQPVERQLATWLSNLHPEWQRVSIHDDKAGGPGAGMPRLARRHGLTIMQRRVDLSVV